MARTLYDELKSLGPGVVVKYKGATPKQREAVEVINGEIEYDERRRIIDRYIKNGFVQRVVEGEDSFRQVCQPIIERCLTLERKVAEAKKPMVVTRDMLFGNDDREDNAVLESVRYLEEQRIINPRGFLKGTNKIYSFFDKNPVPKICGLFAVTTIAGGYLGYLWPMSETEKLGSSVTGYLLGMVAGVLPFISIALNLPIRHISEQRQNFENALDYLDNEVKRLYRTQDYSI